MKHKGQELRSDIIINGQYRKQIIYTNAFSIDFFVGAGYAFGKLHPELHYYAFVATRDDVAFIISGGVRVGFLF